MIKIKSIKIENLEIIMNSNENGLYNVLHLRKGSESNFPSILNQNYEDTIEIFDFYQDMLLGNDQ